MKRTVEEINVQIAELTAERNRASAITADGVPIEVGMTLYAWDFDGIEVYEVSEKALFKERAIWQVEPTFISEDYTDLFADVEKAKETILRRSKEDVIRAERNFIAAQTRLEKLEANIAEDLGESNE